MKDSIYIKSINQNLIWQQTIAQLLPFVSYRWDRTNSEIDINISGQWFNDEIRMVRGEIGRFKVDNLNSVFFEEFKFTSTTEKTKLRDFIKLHSSSKLNFILDGNSISVRYKGQNRKSESQIKFISNIKFHIDPLKAEDWVTSIENLRQASKYQSHEYHFDYNHNKVINFSWFQFSNLEIFGLKHLNWFGYYKPRTNKLHSIETRIGNDEKSFEKVKLQITKTIGNPNLITKPEISNDGNHKIRKEIWDKKNVQISIYSTIIPRVETWTYEVKITNKNSG